MKIKNNLLAFLFVIASCYQSFGQDKSDKYSPERLRADYENIQIIENKIFYEQRLYRNPFIGLFEIDRIAGDTSTNKYVPMFQGMPVGVYELDKSIHYSPLSAKTRAEYFKKNSTFPSQKNYKFDFWIQPYFAAIFGNFERPVQSNTSIALHTQFYIWPGLSLSTGILFPIINQMDSRPKIIRPAPTYLNQFYAKGNHFVSATAGLFNNDQYGLNIQYRRADLGKPLSFGVEAGLTGYYYYPKGGIYVEKLDQLLFLVDAAYRFRGPDMTVKLSGGQFLWSDKGARFDLVRQFTNVEIGVYATKTENGSTVGFNFAVPIPPGKIAQGRRARLRTTDEFRWEYTYTRGYQIGERYRLGYQLDQKLRQYHQDYLNHQMQRLGNE